MSITTGSSSDTQNKETRSVFFISDGTAITAEVLGHAVLSQFPIDIIAYTLPLWQPWSVRWKSDKKSIPFLKPPGLRPLVFYSIICQDVREAITGSQGCCQDIVQTLVAPIQKEIQMEPQPIFNRTHGLFKRNLSQYDARIAAIDFALAHDDGVSLRNMDQAQVILLGVSRCGKTLDQSVSGDAVRYPGRQLSVYGG